METSMLLELVQRIRQYQCEYQTVEVKAASGGTPKRLYDTLSSFSNQDTGGVIVFGLDEKKDFEIVGVYDVQALQHDLSEQCKQMEPEVRPLVTTVEIDGKYVVSAEIPGLDIAERPVFYRGAGRLRGSYIRSGDADEPMSEYEIYSYEAFRHRKRDDIRVIDTDVGTRYRQSALDEYLSRLRRKSRHLRDIDSDEELLELMGIRHKGQPTLTGLLNFGVYPQSVFPRLCITAVVVPGTAIGDTGDKGERFLANEMICGTLCEMLEDAITFVERNQRHRTVIGDDGRRRDQPEFPLKAVREVILNALIHRDYSQYTEGTPVTVCMYTDRMEVTNKGGLYGRVCVERLGQTHPDTRNPAIASVMEVLDQTENRYSGIPTIRSEMKKAGLPEPVFRSKNGEFTVILYNGDGPAAEDDATGGVGPLTEQEKRLLQYCSRPRTRIEIASFLGTGWANAKVRYVSGMLKSGLLRMTKPEAPKTRDQGYVAAVKAAPDDR